MTAEAVKLKKDVEHAIAALKKAKSSESPEWATPLENGLLVCLEYFQYQLGKEEGKM